MNASESVSSAEQSLYLASQVFSQMSSVVDTLASALDVSILGVSPLEKASASVKRSLNISYFIKLLVGKFDKILRKESNSNFCKGNEQFCDYF